MHLYVNTRPYEWVEWDPMIFAVLVWDVTKRQPLSGVGPLLQVRDNKCFLKQYTRLYPAVSGLSGLAVNLHTQVDYTRPRLLVFLLLKACLTALALRLSAFGLRESFHFDTIGDTFLSSPQLQGKQAPIGCRFALPPEWEWWDFAFSRLRLIVLGLFPVKGSHLFS